MLGMWGVRERSGRDQQTLQQQLHSAFIFQRAEQCRQRWLDHERFLSDPVESVGESWDWDIVLALAQPLLLLGVSIGIM